MAAEAVVVIDDPPDLESLTVSPEARANLVIRLMGEIVVTGIPADDHDLTLFFLTFQPGLIADLQRLLPALANVTPDLIYA